jgi:phosphonopyruvate decarboxylase
VTGADLATALERAGFDFAAGVPCSLVESLIAVLEDHERVPYLSAVREDVAVGLAAGAWLGGRRPVVVMQNSGLGTSLNALASLSLMYGLPALLLVTWRGWQGRDAPEHILTGRITEPLLELLGIPHRVLAPDTVEADIAWARSAMDARRQPVALLLPPKVLSEGAAGDAGRPSGPAGPALAHRSPGDAGDRGGPGPSRLDDERLVPRISRYAAIAAAVKALGDELVVHANGYPSRESCAIADRPQNFYMIGSMGLAAPIGLGLALARRDRRVVVFDGDGNILMGLGVLANVAAAAPPNLVHCIFDNEVYGSTGNQRSPSAQVRLDRLAAAAGYRSVRAVTAAEDVTAALRAMLAAPGPHALLVKVTPEEADVPRIPLTPAQLRDRFRASVEAA